jgi:hypothetical protein
MKENARIYANKYMYAILPLVQCGTSSTAPCTYKHFFELLGRIFGYLVVLAVPLAVLGIGIGGAMIIFGGASPNMMTQGKDAIKYSIIGLFCAAGAWLIINAVIVGLGAEGFVNPLKGSSPTQNSADIPTNMRENQPSEF